MTSPTTYRHILSINPASPVASDVNELHKLVMAGYRHHLDGATTVSLPDGNQAGPRAQANILFATRRSRPSGRRTWPPTAGSTNRLLVQANVPGQWDDTSYATDRKLNLNVSDPINVDTHVPDGALVQVTGEFHATRRKPPEHKTGKCRGQRYTLTNPNDIGAWAQHAFTEQAGLAVHMDGMEISSPHRLYGRGVGNSTLIIDTCRITLEGTVIDPTRFRHALQTGLGRSRPYGAGLIRHRVLSAT